MLEAEIIIEIQVLSCENYNHVNIRCSYLCPQRLLQILQSLSWLPLFLWATPIILHNFTPTLIPFPLLCNQMWDPGNPPCPSHTYSLTSYPEIQFLWRHSEATLLQSPCRLTDTLWRKESIRGSKPARKSSPPHQAVCTSLWSAEPSLIPCGGEARANNCLFILGVYNLSVQTAALSNSPMKLVNSGSWLIY